MKLFLTFCFSNHKKALKAYEECLDNCKFHSGFILEKNLILIKQDRVDLDVARLIIRKYNGISK